MYGDYTQDLPAGCAGFGPLPRLHVTMGAMPNEAHFRRLERLYRTGPINQFIISSVAVSAGQAEVTLKPEPHYQHGGGVLHGAIYFKALDDACVFAVASQVDDAVVTTATFNVTFARPYTGDLLVATGRLLHASRRLFVAEAEIHDDEGRLVAKGNGTFMKTNHALRPDPEASA